MPHRNASSCITGALSGRFSSVIGSAVAAICVMLPATSTLASAIVRGGEGTLRTSTASGSSSQNCVCNPTAVGFAFPPLANEPLSESLDCPVCQNPNTTITATTGPSHADGAYIGDTHSLTFTTTGFGGGNSTIVSCVAQSQSTGDIGFTVSDQPTAVSIGVSVTCSGPDGDTGVTVTLRSSTGVIATMVVNNTGSVSGSIPTGPFDPDVYDLQIAAFGHWDTFSGAAGYSYSVTATVSADVTPATIHWKNPAGGSFDDSNNWDPQEVPTAIDTAVFDLSSLLGLIHVNAPNDAVANMSINETFVELTGFLDVLQGDSNGGGFKVTQGGQLLLTNAATLITANGWVGSGVTPPSSATVTGAGTHWTVGSASPLSIFDDGKVVVDQSGLLNAQKEIDVGRFGTPGAMEVHNNALVTTPVLKVTADNGTSTLLIDGGGQVQAQATVNVGNSSGGNGTLTISGVSSDGVHHSTLSLTGAGGIEITGGNNTQVEVTDGGILSSPSGSILIGRALAVGKLHAGNNASCGARDITVGSRVVPSELTVDGAVVSSGGAMNVGPNDGELANVTVTSSGLLNIGDNLQVGMFGQGQLTIGSLVSGAKVASARGAVGVTPSLAGNGSGEVTINGSLVASSEWHITGDCVVGSNSVGQVVLHGAFLPLSTTVVGATLTVDGTLTVDALGSLIGNGKVTAGTQVVNAGVVSPGLSPGLIEIDGNYQQTAAGLLKMEVAGTNSGDFDVLHVTGNATIGGTLQVTFLNDFLPKRGDVLPLLQVDGTLSGDFAQITFPQLAPGFQATANLTNGTYQLSASNDAVALPSLKIALSGTNVVLSWPTNTATFRLQSASELSSSAVWNFISTSPLIINGRSTVTNAISDRQQFYRLAQ